MSERQVVGTAGRAVLAALLATSLSGCMSSQYASCSSNGQEDLTNAAKTLEQKLQASSTELRAADCDSGAPGLVAITTDKTWDHDLKQLQAMSCSPATYTYGTGMRCSLDGADVAVLYSDVHTREVRLIEDLRKTG